MCFTKKTEIRKNLKFWIDLNLGKNRIFEKFEVRNISKIDIRKMSKCFTKKPEFEEIWNRILKTLELTGILKKFKRIRILKKIKFRKNLYSEKYRKVLKIDIRKILKKIEIRKISKIDYWKMSKCFTKKIQIRKKLNQLQFWRNLKKTNIENSKISSFSEF